MPDRPCKVLLVYPKFVPNSFWNYTDTCRLLEGRYPAAPLGLITVAALLPQHWQFKLVNRNTENLDTDDIAWADLVMTGGMGNQQPDCLRVIKLAHAYGKPVAVGGPDPMSSPHIYESADFKVLGEAEDIIKDFVAAWERGERSGVFTAEKFQVDVTKTPIPRYDLLKLRQYLYICVQYSRGCPFTCEFCDIIELYGRKPRTKTNAQMLAELERLYELGYRGHVDFVDDNLIGNKKALKAFLPELAAWQKSRDFPFEFSTEASMNLADDDELLAMLRAANFFAVFIGIESPDPETLKQTSKKQNTRRNMVENIHKLYSYGLFVTAGFIVGFDSEKASIADAMADFIEESAIPVAMVGLLYALPNTQLTRRLAQEGRLHEGHDIMREDRGGDQCMIGINYEPARPLRDILTDYKHILERTFDPKAYARRLERLTAMLDRSGRPELATDDRRKTLASLTTVHRILDAIPGGRAAFWDTFLNCVSKNPAALQPIVFLIAMYAHLGPFSRKAIAEIDRRLATLDQTEAARVATARPMATAATAARLPLH
ncbi:MAG TPA: B12-binding domain-containing radical SAM protein [Pseudolabrys sp.]|nr:B12-binding domain-containing radical SAM protein [Pseudolabrys sp.]